MFRELEDLPESSAQFQRQRDRIVGAVPAAGRLTSPAGSTGAASHATIWCRWPAWDLVNAVIRFDVARRVGFRVVRGADHHG